MGLRRDQRPGQQPHPVIVVVLLRVLLQSLAMYGGGISVDQGRGNGCRLRDQGNGNLLDLCAQLAEVSYRSVYSVANVRLYALRVDPVAENADPQPLNAGVDAVQVVGHRRVPGVGIVGVVTGYGGQGYGAVLDRA